MDMKWNKKPIFYYDGDCIAEQAALRGTVILGDAYNLSGIVLGTLPWWYFEQIIGLGDLQRWLPAFRCSVVFGPVDGRKLSDQ